MLKNLKTAILSISILLFIISLTQPAFYIDRSNSPDGWSNSLGLVLIGWTGTLAGSGAALSWIANPLIFVSWYNLFRNIKASLITGIFAFIFSASFLLFKTVISNEAGHYSLISERKAGYWLWLTSISFFLAGLIIVYLKEKSTREKII